MSARDPCWSHFSKERPEDVLHAIRSPERCFQRMKHVDRESDDRVDAPIVAAVTDEKYVVVEWLEGDMIVGVKMWQ